MLEDGILFCQFMDLLVDFVEFEALVLEGVLRLLLCYFEFLDVAVVLELHLLELGLK